MSNILKQLFCNHNSQRLISKIDAMYIDDLYLNPNKYKRTAYWRCERCGKILTKKYKEAFSTFNWEHIMINNTQKENE